MSGDRFPESVIESNSLGRVVAYGDSIPAGGGASSGDRDIMTRVARALGAREYNYALGGSVLYWANSISTSKFGVWAQVFQTHKRPTRFSTTTAAQSGGSGAAGAFNLIVSSVTGLKQYDNIHIGTGATAEVVNVTTIPGTTIGTTQLQFTHAAGEPVYVVPSDYEASNTLYLVCDVHNALASHMPDATLGNWYREAMRSILSRLRSAEVYEIDVACNVFGGSWAASIYAPGASSGVTAAQGLKTPTATGATWTFHVPANFPGGAFGLQWVVDHTTTGAVVSYTVDGVSAGSQTIGPAPVGQLLPVVKRFTNQAAGGHTVVATMTNLGSGATGCYADYSFVEAPAPPAIVFFRPWRFWTYTLYNSSWTYGHILTSTTGTGATAGNSTVQVGQSSLAGLRQITAGSIPAAGETITVDVGGGTQETRKVISVAGASAPFTITVDAPWSSSHGTGQTVHMGIQDADMATMDGFVTTVLGEYDSSILPLGLDNLLHPSPTTKSSKYFFLYDGAHLNDWGHAVGADAVKRLLAFNEALNPTLTSRMAQQRTPIPMQIEFLGPVNTPVAWTNMPSGVTEFLANATFIYRRWADLSNVFEGRMGAVVTTVGSADARLRVQFSIDGGTTWRNLGSIWNGTPPAALLATEWRDSTLGTDKVGMEVSVASTGLKTTGDAGYWQPIHPDAQVENCLLRLIGVGGNGTADPAFAAAWLELR